MLIGDHDLVPIAIGVVDERIGSEAALGPSKAAAKPPFDRARIKTDEIAAHRAGRQLQIGRASCRERVCQYVKISVVAVSFKKKKEHKRISITHNTYIKSQQHKYTNTM